MLRPICALMLASSVCACASTRRATSIPYVGAVAGISTLSADARAIVREAGAEASLYKPENGGALNLLAGLHLSDYLSVQGNWVWNRNQLTLSAVRSVDGTFFEERRDSAQHAFVADALLYFRDRDSWARPYLSAGVGLVRFAAGEPTQLESQGGLVRPPATFAATDPALRVAVGIDLGAVAGWRVRYSFSETISDNPISDRLSPRALRRLANFQNLFGAIRSF